MRGENARNMAGDLIFAGTPPHAWGKRRHVKNLFRKRNTPTCVGKTPKHKEGKEHGQEHPHMRGETSGEKVSVSPDFGPPPHAWGKLVIAAALEVNTRNTPTCVGKTSGGRWWGAGRRNTPTCVGKTLFRKTHRKSCRWHYTTHRRALQSLTNRTQN